jgi:hypothetical protein
MGWMGSYEKCTPEQKDALSFANVKAAGIEGDEEDGRLAVGPAPSYSPGREPLPTDFSMSEFCITGLCRCWDRPPRARSMVRIHGRVRADGLGRE